VDDEFEDLHCLWDGSERWVVDRYFEDETVVRIFFSAGRPTVREVVAIRKLLPEYRDLPPGEVVRRLGSTGSMTVDAMSTARAGELTEHARLLGLVTETIDASHIGYMPIRLNDEGQPDLMRKYEDDEVARRVCERMLREGVPFYEKQGRDGE